MQKEFLHIEIDSLIFLKKQLFLKSPIEILKNYKEVFNFDKIFDSYEELMKIEKKFCEKNQNQEKSHQPIWVKIHDIYNGQNLTIIIKIEELSKMELKVTIFLKKINQNDQIVTYTKLLVKKIIDNSQ